MLRCCGLTLRLVVAAVGTASDERDLIFEVPVSLAHAVLARRMLLAASARTMLLARRLNRGLATTTYDASLLGDARASQETAESVRSGRVGV